MPTILPDKYVLKKSIVIHHYRKKQREITWKNISTEQMPDPFIVNCSNILGFIRISAILILES
jgi:hypothetical protein